MLLFTQLLSPQNIRQGLICSSKKRAFEIITHITAEQVEMENAEQYCFECLLNREKLGNSGLGNGVAMPKARIAQGDKPIAVFLQLDTPIDYETNDHREVDLIFALLVPETICPTYVQELPKLAEKLLDKNLCKQLRMAQSADEIWQIFEYADHHELELQDHNAEE